MSWWVVSDYGFVEIVEAPSKEKALEEAAIRWDYKPDSRTWDECLASAKAVELTPEQAEILQLGKP